MKEISTIIVCSHCNFCDEASLPCALDLLGLSHTSSMLCALHLLESREVLLIQRSSPINNQRCSEPTAVSEMASQIEWRSTHQPAQASKMDSQFLEASKTPFDLRPIRAFLPAEIWTLIGEASVEPYHLCTESDPTKLTFDPVHVRVSRSQATPGLGILCSDFDVGIKRGLRKRFVGHIQVYSFPLECLLEVLKHYRLEWVFPEIKSISL